MDFSNIETYEDRQKIKHKKLLVDMINSHLKHNKTYTFRSVKIDGVNCYVVIHNKYKIINFEAIHIYCVLEKYGMKNKQKYSLFYENYNTIEEALDIIEEVVANYRIANGDLMHPNHYNVMKLEKSIIPYNDNQCCCICNENTMDITVCNHYICFHCREKCIMNGNKSCPVCREEDILHIYNIDNGLINNKEETILKYAIEYETNSVIDEDNHYIDNDNEEDIFNDAFIYEDDEDIIDENQSDLDIKNIDIQPLTIYEKVCRFLQNN
jgi:hypothetical protein